MGRHLAHSLKPFTKDELANRDLIIEMLKWESEFTKGSEGQSMYKNPLNAPLISLTIEHAINRKTLAQFGFDTSVNSVDNYRTIFRTYFKSPDDYDEEVINSSHYMRNNRCVFYTHKPMEIGQIIPNCRLFELDGKTEITLYDAIKRNPSTITVFAAFSLSWPPFLGRIDRLFGLKDRLDKHNFQVILIQTEEAHSSAWPVGLDNQPEPQQTFQDRIDRANQFITEYNPPYAVYIDGWDNQFEQLFRAWPDKFHCVDSNLKVIEKSEYGKHTDALINKDYTVLLEELTNRQ